MRVAYAMADHPTPDWLGPTMLFGGSVVTAVLAFFGIRTQAKAPKADPQEAINHGFNDLLDQMRQELKAASKERNHLNAVLEEERRSWRTERDALMGRIAQLQAVAEGFERLLRRNGIALPERKTYPEAPDHAPAQLVDTTLRQGDMED